MATNVQNTHSNENEKIPWKSMRASRTQAMPKHSLFGTALEQVDRESLKDIQGKYIYEGSVKKPPNRYPLPEHIRASMPGRDSLENTRREILLQQNLWSEADEILKDKSEKVFSFKGVSSHNRTSKSSNSKRSSNQGWLTERDLEHSEDINIVGLNPHGNYNRDKYGRKRQMHNYSLIGDLLAPNMDFNSHQNERRDKTMQQISMENVIRESGRNKPANRKLEQNAHLQKNSSRSLIDLPPNIRHKFGSRECDNLFSDQNIVSLAIERQKEKSGPPRPSKKENIEAIPVDMSDNYTGLGHITRYNICPGISSGHTISRTQLEFNDEVHLKRVPDTDEFRYQRDELSIWVEQDVLRRRMQGKWKSYFESMPKVTANWDRNAKRPVVTVPQPVKPKQQPKPKNKISKKAETHSTANNEDEIVFVTPPLTPPPQQEEPIELPKSFNRDEEFWSFYDQTVP